MSRRARAAVVVALLAAGCGSTVQVSSNLQAGTTGATTDGLTTQAPASLNSLPAATAPSSPGGTGAQQPAGAPALAQATTSLPSGEALAHGVDGPGVTATTITIGLAYAKNADAYQAALGNTNVTSGDVGRMMHVLVDDTNAHGGIAGRRLLTVDYTVDPTTDQTKTASQIQSEECATFTQDHHVFAMMPGGGPELLACLHKSGAMAVQAGNVVSDTTAEYDRYPENFDVSAISIDRLATNLVPVLKRTGYFSPWDTTQGKPGATPAVVGILVPDQPRFHRGVAVLLGALKAVGITVRPENVAYFYWPKSTAEDGQAVTDIQGYALKLRSNGVTHLIPLEQNATVFFGAAADKQRYYPRYALNSATAAQGYNGNLLPSTQLRGAVGLGYFPATDLLGSDNPDNGPYSSPARRACIALLRSKGISFANTNEQAVGMLVCDGMWNVKRVLESVPPAAGLNQASVAAALDRIGTLPSGVLTSVSYGPHHRDAVSGGWVYRFEESCTCVRYSGPRFPLA